MEAKFQLKQKAIIKVTGMKGIVIGIWFRAYGEPQYQLRYYDQNDMQANSWFAAEELDAEQSQIENQKS